MRLSLTSSRERNVRCVDLMLLRQSSSYCYSSQRSYQEVSHHRRMNERGKASTQRILPRARQSLQSAANEWHLGKKLAKAYHSGDFQTAIHRAMSKPPASCLYMAERP